MLDKVINDICVYIALKADEGFNRVRTERFDYLNTTITDSRMEVNTNSALIATDIPIIKNVFKSAGYEIAENVFENTVTFEIEW